MEHSLQGMILKHKDHLKEIEVCMSFTTDLAESLAQNEHYPEKIEELEANVISYVKMSQDVQAHLVTLKELSDSIRMTPDLDTVGFFKTKLDQHKRKLHSTDPKNHEKFQKFKEVLWKVEHPGEPFPGIGINMDDDLVFVSQDVTELVCPLTRAPFERPVRNNCGHTYSYEAVMSVIRGAKRGRGAVRCPVAGCSGTVNESTLERDVEMERLMKRRKNTRKEPEAEEIVDDI